MNSITPIETRYGGRFYRSRTEARWAVFFDELGLTFEYEKEGYVLIGRRYLPDFWSPEIGWFEVKGREPTPEEVELIRALSQATRRRAYLAVGSPDERLANIYTTDGGSLEAGGVRGMLREEYDEDGSVVRSEDVSAFLPEDQFFAERASRGIIWGKCEYGQVERAFDLAKSERFERYR